MQINPGQTTFTQMYQQTKAGGQFENVPGEKHLRLSATGDLHTHREDKGSGIHFLDRAEKHKQAAAAVKAALDLEFGTPGLGDRIFARLGLDKMVKVSDLALIRGQIGHAQDDLARQETLDQARPLQGQYQNVKATLMYRMGQLPSVLTTAKPMAADNTGIDYFRANINDADKRTALTKLQSQGNQQLDGREAAGVVKAMFYEPVAPLGKLAKLANHPALDDAVGYYTGKNTLQATVVAKNAVPAQDTADAVVELRKAIDKTLTPTEKAALKERIDFIVDMAPLMHAKIGHCNTRVEDANDQDKLWMKSMAVSYPLFLGGTNEGVNGAIGGTANEAAVKGRNLVTALAVHRDAIFG